MHSEPEHAVLVVDDEPASVELLRITLGPDYKVYTTSGGDEALQALDAHPEIALAIIDQRMPRMSGTELIQRTVDRYPDLIRVILTGYTDADALVEAINTGKVYRYLTKPWRKDELLGVVRQGLEVYRLSAENAQLQSELREANERLRVENLQLRRDVGRRVRFDEIGGSSPALTRVLDVVERVAASDTTVLITGETGSGKELIARAIHFNGPRAKRPFVVENCGALSPDLLASELFGHRKGAFTGAARDRRGIFETAHTGTVFLDEVGDCSSDLQNGLLRVLDHGEVRRIGDEKPIKVDVRVIAATNRDLDKAVREGRFRSDLFFRLSVINLEVPPLRARREDIPELAERLLRERMDSSGKRVRGLTPETLRLLQEYDYPGNIRELRNEIERALTLCDADGYITPDLLSPKFAAVPVPAASSNDLKAAVERFEAGFITDALARFDNNQSRTAQELNVSRSTLIEKMKRHGIR